ncbi:MAG: murein biosynthesis integral membrane protein MurJ [Ahrensia sp.]
MGLIAKFASVGGATAASRVLGFVREAMIAATLGAGPVADAFYAAFRFPNLFRRLFAEGAFNSAFIPLFAKAIEADGENVTGGEAERFAGEVFSVLATILVSLTAIAILAMPFLVNTIIAPAFSDTPDKFDLTVTLARIMFPYLAFMSLVAMLSGILNAFRRYFVAALAPVLLNVVLIGVLAYALWFDLDDPALGVGLAIGVVVAGVLQLAALVIGLRQTGFSFRPRKPRLSPQVRRLLVLAAPAALTGGIVQINLVIGQIIASAQDGAIALLSYADRLYQLPLGVIGIAISVVLLPELSRALKANDAPEVLSLQNKSLEFGLGLTVPAAVALALIPGPVIAIVFERGAFTPETTALTAAALAAFAIGLPSFVLIKVFQPAYFAREDMRTPMWISLIAVAVNVAVSLALFPAYGHVGIAVATTVSGWCNAAMLAGILWRRNAFRPSRTTLLRVLKITICAMVMGGFLVAWFGVFGSRFDTGNILLRLTIFLPALALCMIIYFGLALLSGGMDRSALMRSLRRKRANA